jgi:predicted RNA binding protein YcfA (HicA-like mRNA interferase family)
MPDLYSAKSVLKALKHAGFKKISQKGSHIKLRGISEGKILTVIVPNHKTIAKGTFSSILRQADLTKAEFESHL